MKKMLLAVVCVFIFLGCGNNSESRGSRISTFVDTTNDTITIRFGYHTESTGYHDSVIYDYFVLLRNDDPRMRARLTLIEPHDDIEEMRIFVDNEEEIFYILTRYINAQARDNHNHNIVELASKYLLLWRQKLNTERRIAEILNSYGG